MAVYTSVEAASEACRGYVRFDGGGRWRVYGTKLVSAGGTVQVVRDLVLAAGFEPLAVPARLRTGRKGTFRPSNGPLSHSGGPCHPQGRSVAEEGA